MKRISEWDQDKVREWIKVIALLLIALFMFQTVGKLNDIQRTLYINIDTSIDSISSSISNNLIDISSSIDSISSTMRYK